MKKEDALRNLFFEKKILITGGAGFIGSNLAKRLINYGAKITLYVKQGSNLENINDIKNDIEIIEKNPESDIKKIIMNKDYLFHFAWQTDLKKSMENPENDLEEDLIGLVKILEACRKCNPDIKIIFSSTVTITSECEKIPVNEFEKENPLSIYDLNKLLAEKYLQMYWKNYKIKSTILRLSNVFGEGQKIDNPSRGVLNFMIGRALRGEALTVYGDGEFIRDYNYIQNIVDAFLLAAVSDKTNGEFFVMGSGRGISFNEVVTKIKKIVEEIAKKSVQITYIPFPDDEHKINKRNFVADYRKFSDATGWTPQIGFEEGLQKTIDFYYKKEFSKNGIK